MKLIRINGKPWTEVKSEESLEITEYEVARVCSRCGRVVGIIQCAEPQDLHITHTYCPRCADEVIKCIQI